MLSVEEDRYVPTWTEVESGRARVVYALRVDGIVTNLYASPENYMLMSSGDDGRVPDDARNWLVRYVDQVSMVLPC